MLENAPWIGLFFAFVAIGLLFNWKHFKRRRAVIDSLQEALAFSKRMEKVTAHFHINVEKEFGRNHLERSVVGISRRLAQEALRRSGLIFSAADADDLFTLQLMALIISNFFTYQAGKLSFEETGLAVCETLRHDLSDLPPGSVFGEAVAEYNNPRNARIVQGIGGCVASFWTNALFSIEDKHLNALGQMYLHLRESAGGTHP